MTAVDVTALLIDAMRKIASVFIALPASMSLIP
jgi:hypothetical protein